MTGYTYELVNKDLDFPDFAKLCARAFGALIMMRDDPLDAKIPEKFEPSDHHKKEKERKEKELSSLSALKTKKDKMKWAKDKIESKISEIRKYVAEKAAENKRILNRLEETLSKTKAWVAPSDDHVKFKEFMIDQLQSSIEGEKSCNNYYEQEIGDLQKHLKNPLNYFEFYVSLIERDIEYHHKSYAEEVKRTNTNNEWIRKLVESLGEK